MKDRLIQSKAELKHNERFKGFEIWVGGKRQFAMNDVIVWQMDCLMVARFGDNLPMWSDDGGECDISITTTDSGERYLTVGYVD